MTTVLVALATPALLVALAALMAVAACRPEPAPRRLGGARARSGAR